MKPAIVAIGYNRADSIKRLLSSLNNAVYTTNDVKLIISIDHSKKENDEKNIAVLNAAKEFEWKHGEKEVIYREKNMGLRPHVLACGDLSQEYGSIIMLEDDIFVSPMFYEYACQALAFSADKDYLAGISLYNHRLNFQTREAFYPIEDGFDNWYLKFPMSWGQAWTSDQWNGFRKWYDENSEKPLECAEMPPSVSAWPGTSWMKYFAKYIIENNKFLLYPKHSFTTNFCDVGTNASVVDLSFQVPMAYMLHRPFIFSDISESLSVYDQFFENVNLYKYLDIPWNRLTVDLYGHKPIPDSGYLLSRKQLNFKVVKSFSCVQKPIEMNIITSVPGKHLYLYNLSEVSENKFDSSCTIPLTYQFKGLTRKKEIAIIKRFIKNLYYAVKRRIVKK